MSARRPLFTLVVALAALLVVPTAAQALSVRVVDLQGKSATVDLADLQGQEDVNDVDYAIRSASGTSTQTVTGFSLDNVIRASGADPFSYTYLNVSRPGGGSVQLTNGQVRNSGSPDGPPVVYEAGADVGFIRPSTGDGDRNAADSFKVPGGLVVTLQRGTPIGIEVHASDVKVEVGDVVDFTAAITHPSSMQPDVSWSFGDGQRAVGVEEISHKFKQGGTYYVVVTATDPDTGQGPSASVEIQVGEKKKGGPDRHGGGEDKGNDAPDSGSSTGTGGEASGTGTGVPTGPIGSAGVPTGPVAPAAPTDPEQRRDERAPEQPIGDEVSGRVLDDVTVIPAPPERRREEAPAPTLRTGEEQGGLGVSGAALGGMAVAALLGFGALAQAGRIRFDSVLWHLNRLAGR